MKNAKLGNVWDSLRASYWFVPTVMAIGAVILSTVMLAIDSAEIQILKDLRWIYTGGPSGARQVLSTVAGSMATVATTAFSITIVALQLASSNFGSRLLRNFMQDTGNQVVLGSFVSTFVYSLLVLRTIHDESFDLFVPQLSITVGMSLAILSIGVLIYFIHHAATMIQASHVIAEVSDELHDAIDRLFPEPIGEEAPNHCQPMSEIPKDFASVAIPIKAERTGYLQVVDDVSLMKLAKQQDLIIHLQLRPGQFVIQGSEIAKAYPADRVDAEVAKRLNGALILGSERIEQQDVEFPVDQLVETAVRALSPGVNDPFTAIRCIDRLGAGLCRLAQREMPSPYRYDDEKTLRVIAEPVTFDILVNAALNPIRQYAKPDVAVTVRLLNALRTIASCTSNSTQRAILQRHADMIFRGSEIGLSEECDRNDVKAQYDRVMQALKQS